MERPRGRLRHGRPLLGRASTPPRLDRGWGGARRISGTAVGCRRGRGARACRHGRGRKGGGERGAAAANKSTEPREGPSSAWTRPRGWPWGVSSRTWPRRGKGRGAAAAEDAKGWPQGPSSPRASLRGQSVGDGFPDEDIRGRGSGDCSCGRGHRIALRSRGTSPLADKAARTAVGDIVADNAAAGRGSTARCRRRGHGDGRGARPWGMPLPWPRQGEKGSGCRRHGRGQETAAGVFASVDKPVRTAVGDDFAVEAARVSGRGGPQLRTRPLDG